MMACRRKSRQSGNQREFCMGTIIEFPADAASRRPGSTMDGAARDAIGTILILPVVRIERETEAPRGGTGPEEGTGRRRRRR